MSFWSVPSRTARGTRWVSATAMYIANSTAAGELIVIEVETLSSGIPSNKLSMSSTVSMATPSRPTSPIASGSSESRPISVGRSNATESPVVPWASRYL